MFYGYWFIWLQPPHPLDPTTQSKFNFNPNHPPSSSGTPRFLSTHSCLGATRWQRWLSLPRMPVCIWRAVCNVFFLTWVVRSGFVVGISIGYAIAVSLTCLRLVVKIIKRRLWWNDFWAIISLVMLVAKWILTVEASNPEGMFNCWICAIFYF